MCCKFLVCLHNTQVPTNSPDKNFTLNELKPHTYYRFQVAVQEKGRTGLYSKWIKVALGLYCKYDLSLHNSRTAKAAGDAFASLNSKILLSKVGLGQN